MTAPLHAYWSANNVGQMTKTNRRNKATYRARWWRWEVGVALSDRKERRRKKKKRGRDSLEIMFAATLHPAAVCSVAAGANNMMMSLVGREGCRGGGASLYSKHRGEATWTTREDLPPQPSPPRPPLQLPHTQQHRNTNTIHYKYVCCWYVHFWVFFMGKLQCRQMGAFAQGLEPWSNDWMRHEHWPLIGGDDHVNMLV